jgi:hypothetical protein
LVDYIIFFPGAGSGAYSQAKAIYNPLVQELLPLATISGIKFKESKDYPMMEVYSK